MIIVVSGPGGVGKGTIVDRLVERDAGLWLSRSWTTRARRPSEADDAYRFVDSSTFEAHIEQGGFLEWAEFQGHSYGTPWPEAPTDHDVLLEIDVQGARAVRERRPDALLVFVDAPNRMIQADRLRSRGDDVDAVQRRVGAAERERALADELGSVIVINDDLEAAVAEIQSLIERRRGREHR